MNTKHIFAAIGVVAALAVMTPAYAGSLGGGRAAAWAAAFPE